MKVIVFGGTGFLGNEIVQLLAEEGYEVTACSRGRHPRIQQEKVTYITADKSNPQETKEVFNTRYDVVIDTVPSLLSLKNITTHARGLKHYLHCSSVALYTPLPYIPCDEKAPFEGKLFPNGSEKIDTDREAMRLFHEKGFPATVIRSAYICAPGCYPLDNLGDRRKTFALDMASGTPLDVVNDGQALIQPVHIFDLANAFRLSLEHRSVAVGECYNIAQEKALPLDRYFTVMSESFGHTLEIHHLPAEEMVRKYSTAVDEFWLRFHAMHMCFTMEKAKRELEYRPHLTTEEVIEQTIQWAHSQCRDQ